MISPPAAFAGVLAGQTPTEWVAGRWDVGNTVRLPHDAASAAAARRQVSAEMTAQQVGDRLADDVALVISELVANSVRHASPMKGGGLEVSWEVRRDAVELRVTDGGGAAVPQPRQVGPDEVSGRGLTIVSKLADWGVQATPGGTTVWAVVRVRAPEGANPGGTARAG